MQQLQIDALIRCLPPCPSLKIHLLPSFLQHPLCAPRSATKALFMSKWDAPCTIFSDLFLHALFRYRIAAMPHTSSFVNHGEGGSTTEKQQSLAEMASVSSNPERKKSHPSMQEDPQKSNNSVDFSTEFTCAFLFSPL